MRTRTLLLLSSLIGISLGLSFLARKRLLPGDHLGGAGTSPVARTLATEDPMSAQPYRKTYSVARAYNARLDTCVDFNVEVIPPAGADVAWKPQPPIDLIQKLGKLGLSIERPCTEQFARRAVLATCVTTKRRDSQTLQLVEHHYEYATVGVDDTRMEDCVRMGGEWQALARNSEDFLHAKRLAIVRDLEAITEGS